VGRAQHRGPQGAEDGGGEVNCRAARTAEPRDLPNGVSAHRTTRRRATQWFLAAAICFTPVAGSAQTIGSAALAESIEGLGQTMRVLMIGAHPDDEDTQVISWLSRGLHVETAYLSLTRGDGGQNAIGNELGEALGVIRTEELLAARRVDGGKQFFTRAYDYGFSKSAEEAFTQWPHDSLLRDVLTVVRRFRPHVIIAVFTGTPRDGHGQHQASGILAREAYDLAADTARFPRATTADQGAWTVSKFYRGAGFRRESGTLTFNVGTYDPVLGRSYAEVAAISRSQHRSQAFGTLQQKGVRMDALQREATRVPAPEDPKQEQSIFDGIDTSWARLRSGAFGAASLAALDSIPAALAATRAAFDAFAPERSVPSLARLQRLVRNVCANDPLTEACAWTDRNSPPPPAPARGYLAGSKPGSAANGDVSRTRDVALGRINQALALASGVAIEATAPRELWATDEPVSGTLTIYNRGRLPIQFVDFVSPTIAGAGSMVSHPPVASIAPDSAAVREFRGRAFGRPTAPWWLAESRVGATYANLSIRADEGQSFPDASMTVGLTVDGAGFDVTVPVVHRYADQVRGEQNRPIAGVPAVSVLLDQEFEYAAARAPLERQIRVHLQTAGTGAKAVKVSLTLPAGLLADSTMKSIEVPQPGVVQTVSFTVRGQLPAGRHVVEVTATDLSGNEYRQGYTTIDYEHIRARRLYRPSQLVLQAVDLVAGGPRRIGYVQGVGDNSMPALAQLGYQVVPVDPATLGQADLSGFDAIVVGPRAYETIPALVINNARLLEYVRDGGTMVVQYGQYEMQQPGIMPYPITINRPHDRVTDETAPVTILDSTSTVLRAPNRITSADFDGWVQDRSLYMPRTFDPNYVPSLAMSDPGEQPNRGAVLVAPYGKGTYVYTTLAFFRQLPNGVPGAARLFANLLAAKAPGVAQ